jgi:prevent-host-death family protein
MATIVNIHAAKTQLSRLVEQAAAGEEIVIAKAGKPVARLVPLEPTQPKPKRRLLGPLKGKIKIPDDFDTMMADEIVDMFEGR